MVCPAKYRKVVFIPGVDEELKKICLEIAKRYEIHFLEIGTDQDHTHFLVQTVPTYSPTKVARLVKSITAREMFKRRPEVKKELWGGEFWSDGYFVNTVGRTGSELAVRNYVKSQGIPSYKQIHQDQLRLDLDTP